VTTAVHPSGKAQRRDRAALARLWGLLYRAVRRSVHRTDELQERVNELNAQVAWLLGSVHTLTGRVEFLRQRLVDEGLLLDGEGLP
jgi:hypothetical protein